MVSTNHSQTTLTELILPEKRVSLRHISWQAYEAILAALGEARNTQLTYYQETLELMSPLEAHENASGLIGQFIEILTEELNLNIKSLESTTLHRPELQAGAEPDQSYYIINEPQVRGRTVDLTTDPPPDLIVEVDITHTDINKNALYAEMGIPEFWRYNGKNLQIYQLQATQYQETNTSPTFPTVPKQRLYQFLADCAYQGETAAKRNLRAWIRQQKL